MAAEWGAGEQGEFWLWVYEYLVPAIVPAALSALALLPWGNARLDAYPRAIGICMLLLGVLPFSLDAAAHWLGLQVPVQLEQASSAVLEVCAVFALALKAMVKRNQRWLVAAILVGAGLLYIGVEGDLRHGSSILFVALLAVMALVPFVPPKYAKPRAAVLVTE
jgi:hypothetical protein